MRQGSCWMAMGLALVALAIAGCGPAVGAAAIAIGLGSDSGGSSDSGDKGGQPVPPLPPAQGILDPSFGGGSGYTILAETTGPGTDDLGGAITVDPLGRILISGSVSAAGDDDMIVWRLHDDGSLDSSFNGQGWVTHGDAAGGTGDDSGGAGVVVDSKGRIIVAGSSWAGLADRNDVAVWRILDNGAMDPAFNVQGFLTVHNIAGAASSDSAGGLTLDSADRILVTGSSTGNTPDMFVLRIDVDGTLDDSFGYGGAVVHTDAAGGPGTDGGADIAIDTRGRIVVAGNSMGPGGSGFFGVVWRFTSNGALDPGFAGQGFVILEPTNQAFPSNGVSAVALDEAGRIVAAGSGSITSNVEIIVWRVEEDGDPDITFDGKGWAFHRDAAGQGDDRGRGMAIEPCGRIVVCGESLSPGIGLEVVTWRFLPMGSIDGTFGTGGFIIEPDPAGGTRDDRARAVIIDDIGRIVVLAEWRASPRQTVVLRYE